jgi:tetratricopeptide (TPR) repeat protein
MEEATFQSAMNSLQAIRCQEAIAAFTEALQTRPSSAQGFYNRGIAYLRVGQLQEALSDFKAALRLNPNLSEAHLGKGNVYAELNDLEAAIESYNHRLEALPNDATTVFNRATAYAELGNTSSALSDYQRARDLFSEQGDITTAQKALGRLQRLNELAKPQDFTPIKTKSAGTSNDEPDPLVRDKLLRLLKQDRSMAERLIDQAKKNDPNRSESWYWEKVLWDLERDRFR